MNDFTKDELRNILIWANYYCMDSLESQEVCRSFINKIKSMIDNYCEHTIINIDESCKPCIKCNKDFS